MATKKPKLGSKAKFKDLVGDLTKKGIRNPKALASWLGRKKLGKKKFQSIAAKGKAKKASVKKRRTIYS